VARESPIVRFVNGRKCVVIAGINMVSVSATEPCASKPALPAKQSNTKGCCQSMFYGVRITVVEAGAAGAGVTMVVEALGGDDVVSACTHPTKPMSTNGNRNMWRIESPECSINRIDYRGERQNDMHIGVILMTAA
jgi:hypothetical protein